MCSQHCQIRNFVEPFSIFGSFSYMTWPLGLLSLLESVWSPPKNNIKSPDSTHFHDSLICFHWNQQHSSEITPGAVFTLAAMIQQCEFRQPSSSGKAIYTVLLPLRRTNSWCLNCLHTPDTDEGFSLSSFLTSSLPAEHCSVSHLCNGVILCPKCIPMVEWLITSVAETYPKSEDAQKLATGLNLLRIGWS